MTCSSTTLVTMLAGSIVVMTGLAAQPASQQIALHVVETAGIRRATYPVNARVPFRRGAMADASHVRLLMNGAEVPVQIQAETRWPDGTVQWLDLDFNASIGPLEKADYAVEYGPSVTTPAPPRGLSVTDGAETIQAGNVTFGKNASPLLRSVKFRDEYIAADHASNGLSIVDAGGVAHDFVTSGPDAVKVVKSGPLFVKLEYTGQVAIDPTTHIQVVLTVEMPNSKSWVKVAATAQDPAAHLSAMALHTPLALGAYPWLWDFGTSKGTYGVFRAATDRATLTEARKNGGKIDWRVELAAGGRPAQVAEIAAGDNASVRWGHIQDGKDVIAFALDAGSVGSSAIEVDGAGQISFRVASTAPSREHRFVVYEHFVTSPVQIGAATSPAAMLAPLIATCDPAQYTSSGVGAYVR